MLRKQKMQVLLAEAVGTALLASAVLVASSKFGLGTAAWYVSITAGATLALIVALFGRVSGAHVNPAVTLGVWTLKKITTIDAIMYILMQCAGGMIALLLFEYLSGERLSAGSASFTAPVFVAEMLGALIFGMGIASTMDEKRSSGAPAVVIGVSLTIGALIASVASAGYLNPAVALADRTFNVATVIAPIIGLIVGMNLYVFMFTPHKQRVQSRLR